MDNIKFTKKLCEMEANNVNSLNLAFIGDGVWTLIVRDYFCENTNYKNNNLHKLSTRYIKAVFQAQALDIITEDLTELEKAIAKRARNTKMNTVSKNASIGEYKKATSFEAIIGFLYLTNNFDRISYFFDKLKKEFKSSL